MGEARWIDVEKLVGECNGLLRYDIRAAVERGDFDAPAPAAGLDRGKVFKAIQSFRERAHYGEKMDNMLGCFLGDVERGAYDLAPAPPPAPAAEGEAKTHPCPKCGKPIIPFVVMESPRLTGWLCVCGWRQDGGPPPGQPTDVKAAFEALAEASGGAWDGVDAVEFVRELRGDEPPPPAADAPAEGGEVELRAGLEALADGLAEKIKADYAGSEVAKERGLDMAYGSYQGSIMMAIDALIEVRRLLKKGGTA